MFTATSQVFQDIYGFTQAESGLAYLGFGVGSVLSLAVSGIITNRIAIRQMKQGCFRPESRIPPLLVGCWFLPIGLFWYGWSVKARLHWMMPIVGMGFSGVGLMTIIVSQSPYILSLLCLVVSLC
jgi:hypothetical protein